MELCQNKVNSQFYILVEEELEKLLLITPIGQVKKFTKSAFKEPFYSDFDMFCLLKENQIHNYYDFLLIRGRSKYIELAKKDLDEMDTIIEDFYNLSLDEKWGFIQIMENLT